MTTRYLVTGGAGFIGSAVVRTLIASTPHVVMVIDKLTYAGSLANLKVVAGNPRFAFEQADIADTHRMRGVFERFQPNVVLNLAAETHVDRSIDEPAPFINSNVVGVSVLLTEALTYFRQLDKHSQDAFRFHQISTDEVFGSLGLQGSFSEESRYDPSSPYSASKAAADHLVKAWSHTYGLPYLISHCSNTYGPYQFHEKLIPKTIINGLRRRPLPVYGSGENVREWLYVDDCADALIRISERGRIGHNYNVGSSEERRNIDVVRLICQLLDEQCPDGTKHEKLITMVADRPGHDYRYALNSTRVRSEIGWQPRDSFEAGLAKTVRWYFENQSWWTNTI